MASVETRRRASDGGTSYRVRWRLGGTRDGRWQSETFSTYRRADMFRQDVERAGHGWPPNWVKGIGYVRVRPFRDHGL